MKALRLLLLAPLAIAATIPSSPDLGKAEGRCRAGESGPALLIDAIGLKDRTGTLKLEVYPSTDADFLADDNVLLMAGKTFRRVVATIPATGVPQLCVRVPAPGAYSVVLLHDRNSNRKFNWTQDGIGFAGNPKLGWSKPKAAVTRAQAGPGLTKVAVILNYRSGLGMAPLKQG